MNSESGAPHRRRKKEHLAICRDRAVEPDHAQTGLEEYRFIHEALPEIDLAEIDTTCRVFGKKLNAPILISPMTGGTPESREVNRTLAAAAERVGVAMGVGSQRVALIEPELAETFEVRSVAPNILLFANIGAIQLNNGLTVDDCRSLVRMIDADALTLHINPLQEAVQTDGNTNFRGIIEKIRVVCAELGDPVVAKEVGQGISERTARMLAQAGVAGIDTAGAGGTSWSLVESMREAGIKSALGAAFSDWGIPTAESVRLVRKAAPKTVLIASGGLRSGIDAAKTIALGADLVGFGLPLLREATGGVDAVVGKLEHYIAELRAAMFCIGATNLADLRKTKALVAKRTESD